MLNWIIVAICVIGGVGILLIVLRACKVAVWIVILVVIAVVAVKFISTLL